MKSNGIATVVVLSVGVCLPRAAFADAVCGQSLTSCSSTGISVTETSSFGVSVSVTAASGIYATGTESAVYSTGGNCGIWTSGGTGLLANCNGSSCVAGIETQTDGSSANFVGVQAFGATGISAKGSNGNGIEAYTSGVSGASAVYGESDASNTASSFGVAGRVCGNTGTCTAGKGVAIYGDNLSSANGAYAGYFHGNVTATAGFTKPSDSRLKTDVRQVTEAVEQVSQLQGVTFEWKDPGEHTGPGTQWGFIAQDVEKVFPQWVGTDQNGFKTVDYQQAIPVLVEAVRSLQKENDELAVSVDRDFPRGGLGLNNTLGLIGGVAFGGVLVLSRRRPAKESKA